MSWFKKGLISVMWTGWVAEKPGSHRGYNWGSKIQYRIALYPKAFWIHIWLPKWCKGRGYYISIGLWLFAFYRGY